MTNDSNLKEDSFTLVTSQRRNGRKQKKAVPVFASTEDDIDEELVIK